MGEVVMGEVGTGEVVGECDHLHCYLHLFTTTSSPHPRAPHSLISHSMHTLLPSSSATPCSSLPRQPLTPIRPLPFTPTSERYPNP